MALRDKLHRHGALHGGHSHGSIDPEITASADGIRAVFHSFIILMVTALFQVYVVYLSGSVALLADTVHNFADAGTSIPLWVAFLLARRGPTSRFPYGLGRVEDFAGVLIVLVIAFSAAVAGYQTVERFVNPQPLSHLGILMVASVIGFLGNELAAWVRISTGRRINSAALIADGHHALIDGLTSLAVLLGAVGVYLGYPLADPIAGAVVTIMIIQIVWQSAKTVFARALDGIEPETQAQLSHAIGHVDGIVAVEELRARWVGHSLWVETEVSARPTLSLKEADALAEEVQSELRAHLPHIKHAAVRVRPAIAIRFPGRESDDTCGPAPGSDGPTPQAG